MKYFLYISLLLNSVFAESFQNYLQKHNQQFYNYQQNFEKEFEDYKNAYNEALKEYKNNIKQYWPKAEVSEQHKWVQYINGYQAKQVIDYSKEELRFEVFAQHEKEALSKIQTIYNKMGKLTIKDINKEDIIENKIAYKLGTTYEPLKIDEELLGSMLDKSEQKQIKEELSQKKLKHVIHNDKNIFVTRIAMPPNSILKRAQKYSHIIKEENKNNNLSEELIHAIIHTESSFNPLARSYIPAFGLMQIVPKSAGIDAYYHLYGKKKILSSRYLYNPTNNIKLGATYLKILYYEYLKDIKDPNNRLQCTIAAYNTGTGNVAKAFIKNGNIKEAAKIINTLNSAQVYKRMMKKLPYKETRKYLFKVNRNLKFYKKYLSQKN
jgi:membrane-bound lytic murein transglycosylase C